MRTDNINIFHDTLNILNQGFYTYNGKKILLKLSPARMREISVYLPKDVKNICEDTKFELTHKAANRVLYSCENIDSYSLARKRTKEAADYLPEGAKPVLVLNLANPVNPGGGVRNGAKAQEEDLCRKSSLLWLGKQVTPFDAKVWDAVKYDVVKAGNRAKYEQNPDLKEMLLSTGDSIMAEASPKDYVWGIAMDAKTAAKTDPSKWPGENLLGRILMELREEFGGGHSTEV